MFKTFQAAIVACLIAGATPANAASLQFTITGTDNASFLLDLDGPTILNTQPGDDYLYYRDFQGTYNGVVGTMRFSILDAAAGGGIWVQSVPTEQEFSLLGPVVYQGDLAHPTFVPGSTFNFTLNADNQPVNDTLVISDPSAVPAVPEPASWALMLLGFAAVGFALRRQLPATEFARNLPCRAS